MGQIKKNSQFLFGFSVCAVLLLGCASAKFSYRYYGLILERYTGTLQGPEPKDDLDAKVCEPTPEDAAPCTVMLTSEYKSLKIDYLTIANKLIKCEQGQQ